MFENYFKITLRNIVKNKMYSFLNIMGLALGVAAFIFILQYVTYENSFDKFHSNHESLYRVRYMVERGGELQIDCAAAVPRVGPFMKEKMPEVKDFARAFPISGIMSKDNITYREDRIDIVDPSFLKIFDFPLIQGDINTALTAPNEVVITEDMAIKYFGKTDVIGEQITYASWLNLELKIVGVTENVPNNSHFKYDFLISYETLNNQTQDEEGNIASELSWGWYDFNTYVLVDAGTDPREFDAKFADALYEERGEDFEKYDFKSSFPLQAITDIHLYSDLLQESEPEEQGDGDAVFLLTLIAFFILIIAWINYINLSTARSLERAKEVGIRKTMGAYRKQLVIQFLMEAFVLNLISLLIGIILVILGIRFFNDLTNSVLSLNFLTSSDFWLTGLGIFATGVALSGLYPAFVLSAYEPSQVLKGKFSKNSKGSMLRKFLVTFQFAASIALIAGTIIVFQQLQFMNNADLGFSMTNKMVVKSPSVFRVDSLRESKVRSFKNSLLSNPAVESATLSSVIPGDEIFWTNGIRRQEESDDKVRTTYIASVDYEYFNAYDIDILAGRNYGKSFGADTASIMINLAEAKYLGFNSAEEAVNQKVRFWGRTMNIIGVVDDFNQMSVKTSVAPIVFVLDDEDFNYVTIRLSSDNYSQSINEIENMYAEFFPGNPFDFFFLDDFFNRQYVNEQTFSKVFTLFSAFAIIVACLGLFGLTSFSAIQKTKEIGVRKVLGAKIDQIMMLLMKEFFILIIIANLIAWPVIYFVMDGWLSNFALRIDVGVLVLLLSGILVLLIALATVSYKTFMTARSNPVKALRYE